MNPIHLYSGTNNGFTVTLIATTSMGCMDSTSMTIGYEETASFYIPNTFTPDGDKFNQTFKPIFSSGIDYQNYTMLIYNRWGELVYSTNNIDAKWDGKYKGELQEQDAFAYLLNVTFTDNSTYSKQGSITLMK
jgi:gliding motility-associated-like protein